jgi:hypothetical protein
MRPLWRHLPRPLPAAALRAQALAALSGSPPWLPTGLKPPARHRQRRAGRFWTRPLAAQSGRLPNPGGGLLGFSHRRCRAWRPCPRAARLRTAPGLGGRSTHCPGWRLRAHLPTAPDHIEAPHHYFGGPSCSGDRAGRHLWRSLDGWLVLGPLAVYLALTRPACAGCSWIVGTVVLRRGALFAHSPQELCPPASFDLGGYDRSLIDAIKIIQRHSKSSQ